ncbi:helix-turn-helix domain-containing protein [Streptomyces griseoincarnatus]
MADEGAEDVVTLTIPRTSARALERILSAGLTAAYRADGGRPSPEAERILRELHAAAQGRRHVSVSPPTPTPIVDSGLERMLGTREAAAVLGCDTSHVRRLCLTGRLPARRITGGWLIDSTALDNFRHGHEESSSGKPGPAPPDRAADSR